MKKKITFAAAALLCVACGSVESEEKVDFELSDDSNPELVYKDQNLSGKIGGTKWNFVTGRLTEPHEGSSDKSWGFDLISNNVENVCGEFMLSSEDKLTALFSVEEKHLKKGKIKLGMSGKETQTITLVDSRNGSMNTIAAEGFVEFTQVSKANAAGKMIAHSDDANTIMGKFNLVRCCNSTDGGFGYEVCK